MKPLCLILKKKYFDQIKSGEKTSEYRLITPYWVNRLTNKEYKSVIFQLGYSEKAERIELKFISLNIINLRHEFFGNENVSVFEIKLGKRLL